MQLTFTKRAVTPAEVEAVRLGLEDLSARWAATPLNGSLTLGF